MIHVFVDTETTGLGPFGDPPREDAIIEVGAAYREDGKIVTKSWFCNPGEKYFEKGRAVQALRINGNSMDNILSASDPFTVSRNLYNHLTAHIIKTRNMPLDPTVFWQNYTSGFEFHAFNIPFDKFFLSQDPWYMGQYVKWGVDVMDLSHDFFDLPSDYKIGLKRTMERLGIVPHGEPHRAVTDAISALQVFEAITKKP